MKKRFHVVKVILYTARPNCFFFIQEYNRKAFHSILKSIPLQAGLGGGSADAAAAIKLLNCFYCTGFSTEQLCRIGVKAGADVPFCIRCGTAFAQGIGDKIVNVSPLPDCVILICKPDLGISTAEAYAIADREGFGDIKYTENMICALAHDNLSQAASCLGNCFENILKQEEVFKIKSDIISAGASGACMTGSGSAVFGLFKNGTQAEQCKNKLLEKYNHVFLCNPVRA